MGGANVEFYKIPSIYDPWKFLKKCEGVKMTKSEKKMYSHFKNLTDNTTFALVDSFTEPWHPDGATLDPSFCRQLYPQQLKSASMLSPLFEDV